mmetsp:Transcript_24410/g.96288  ORF Transcript_24410/g.96288 Transcript_24410/m.96288 type:complete len:99 (-) Transcript_24410:3138-3434(-)
MSTIDCAQARDTLQPLGWFDALPRLSLPMSDFDIPLKISTDRQSEEPFDLGLVLFLGASRRDLSNSSSWMEARFATPLVQADSPQGQLEIPAVLLDDD